MKIFFVLIFLTLSTQIFARKHGGLYLEPSLGYTNIKIEFPPSEFGHETIWDFTGPELGLTLGYASKVFYGGLYIGYGHELTLKSEETNTNDPDYLRKSKSDNYFNNVYSGVTLGVLLGKYVRLNIFQDVDNSLKGYNKEGKSVGDDLDLKRYGASLGLRLGNFSYLNFTYGIIDWKDEPDGTDFAWGANIKSYSVSFSFPFGLN